MKFSIITVCFNSSKTIERTIRSVLEQKFKNIEYIIVDGNSKDGTIDIIESYQNRITKFVSESDNGIYNAMNKGIKMATGDIIGILNSDDCFYNDEVISTVAQAFNDDNVSMVYGDVQFINPHDSNKIVRYYSSKKFNKCKFKYGFMPAHPSFYARKEVFQNYGYYKEDYQIAADYELLIRFFYTYNLKNKYIEMPFVSMEIGGISNRSLKNRFILNKEIIRACKENGISTNIFYVYSKYFIKILEFIYLKK